MTGPATNLNCDRLRPSHAALSPPGRPASSGGPAPVPAALAQARQPAAARAAGGLGPRPTRTRNDPLVLPAAWRSRSGESAMIYILLLLILESADHDYSYHNIVSGGLGGPGPGPARRRPFGRPEGLGHAGCGPIGISRRNECECHVEDEARSRAGGQDPGRPGPGHRASSLVLLYYSARRGRGEIGY